MGKYKQWLHHQEVGRRLRDQIANLEQERERVQKMAPGHPTTLPDTDNPLIAALLTYTRQGNSLSQGGAGTADAFRSSSSASVSFSSAGASSPPANDAAVVASLLARADQLTADPLDQAGGLSHGQADGNGASGESAGTGPEGSDSVGGWWQRYRPDDQA